MRQTARKHCMRYLFILMFMSTLFFCSCSQSLYPPSQYIGLFDSYNGYRNGELPSSQKSYTGKWIIKYPNTSKVYVEGSYKNGLPDGVWNSYYFCGKIQFSGIYADGQQKQFISYYPDGIPQAIEISDAQTYSFYPDGTPVGKEKTAELEKRSGWMWNPIYRSSPFYNTEVLADRNMEINTYLFLLPDHTFALWYFITGVTGESKGVVKGMLDPESGNPTSVSSKVYYGDITPDFSGFRKNDSLVMDFVLKETNKKPVTIHIQTNLEHSSSCLSSKEKSVSCSIF